MTQPRLNWDAAPVVTSAVTTSPIARAARRSGRRRVAEMLPMRAWHYRTRLICCGPMTDHEYSEQFAVPLSVVNATRGDITRWASENGLANPVVAIGRVRKDWGSGKATSRTVWRWVGDR